jgi:hypothetical protein
MRIKFTKTDFIKDTYWRNVRVLHIFYRAQTAYPELGTYWQALNDRQDRTDARTHITLWLFNEVTALQCDALRKRGPGAGVSGLTGY